MKMPSFSGPKSLCGAMFLNFTISLGKFEDFPVLLSSAIMLGRMQIDTQTPRYRT